MFAFALIMFGATTLGFAAPTELKPLDFGIYWPPRDPATPAPAKVRPLLQGSVVVTSENSSPEVLAVRLRVRVSRASDEAGRKSWNAQLAFPQYEWMSRVRVWDPDELWLWPNLAYLLRVHGKEREERYGGVDPAKHVDNDFAAVLIRKFDVIGKTESLETKDAPLVAAEWYPLNTPDADKQTIVHAVQSDEFTLHFARAGASPQTLARIWLIYADFMEAKPPATWPKTPEFAGGILACFDLRIDLRAASGSEISLQQITPPSGTGFDWESWTPRTRHAPDSRSTAKLTDETPPSPAIKATTLPVK